MMITHRIVVSRSVSSMWYQYLQLWIFRRIILKTSLLNCNQNTRLIISNSFISQICSIKLHYCMKRRASTAPRGPSKLYTICKRWSRHISFIIKFLIYFALSSDYIAWITTTLLHLDALCNDYCHWICTKMHMIPQATKIEILVAQWSIRRIKKINKSIHMRISNNQHSI